VLIKQIIKFFLCENYASPDVALPLTCLCSSVAPSALLSSEVADATLDTVTGGSVPLPFTGMLSPLGFLSDKVTCCSTNLRCVVDGEPTGDVFILNPPGYRDGGVTLFWFFGNPLKLSSFLLSVFFRKNFKFFLWLHFGNSHLFEIYLDCGKIFSWIFIVNYRLHKEYRLS
jgi:hypothetical protein